MESITNVVQTNVEDSSVLVLPIDHDKRHASYRSLIVSAVLLVFAGAVTTSPSDREIGSNVVHAQSGAAEAEQEQRVHVLSYVSLAQARDSELFLVDCFRPPAAGARGPLKSATTQSSAAHARAHAAGGAVPENFLWWCCPFRRLT